MKHMAGIVFPVNPLPLHGADVALPLEDHPAFRQAARWRDRRDRVSGHRPALAASWMCRSARSRWRRSTTRCPELRAGIRASAASFKRGSTILMRATGGRRGNRLQGHRHRTGGRPDLPVSSRGIFSRTTRSSCPPSPAMWRSRRRRLARVSWWTPTAAPDLFALTLARHFEQGGRCRGFRNLLRVGAPERRRQRHRQRDLPHRLRGSTSSPRSLSRRRNRGGDRPAAQGLHAGVHRPTRRIRPGPAWSMSPAIPPPRCATSNCSPGRLPTRRCPAVRPVPAHPPSRMRDDARQGLIQLRGVAASGSHEAQRAFPTPASALRATARLPRRGCKPLMRFMAASSRHSSRCCEPWRLQAATPAAAANHMAASSRHSSPTHSWRNCRSITHQRAM